jgi:hypothetical protein
VSGLFGFAWSELLVLVFVGVFVLWPLVQRVRKGRGRSR